MYFLLLFNYWGPCHVIVDATLCFTFEFAAGSLLTSIIFLFNVIMIRICHRKFPFFLWKEEEEEARFSEARTWNDSRLVVFFCVLVLSSYKVHVVHLHGQPGQSLLAGQSLCGVVAGGRCGAAVLDEDEDALNCCVNQDRL